jgi:hypothetical protein
MADPNYDQGKRDGLTGNPNPNPPQTSHENDQYWKGRREADYLKEQQANPKSQ